MVTQNDLMAQARKARLADDYAAAENLCRAHLTLHPKDPEAEAFFGLCEIEQGNSAGAARIEAAAAAAPDNPWAALYESILLERRGALRDAVVSANRSVRNGPTLFEAWAQLGKLLGMAEKFPEACEALKHAFSLNNTHAGVSLLLATAALEANDLAACGQALETLDGNRAEVLRLKAHLARKRGDWKGLSDAAGRWLSVDPISDEARIALAHGLSQQGYYDQACDAYEPLAKGRSAPARHIAAMGRYKLGARRLDEAKTYFDRALARDPHCAEAAYGLARRALFLGDFDLVEKNCRLALAADPRHADAWGLLAEAHGGRVGDADLAAINQLAEETAIAPDARATLLFAKGQILHRRKDAPGAFAAWSEANAVKRAEARAAGAGYDRKAQERMTARLASLYAADPLNRAPFAPTSAAPAPIFIVGMPRSGTTLLENALSAHPDVGGAGEVPALPFILEKALASDAGPAPSDTEKREWRDLYFRQCARLGGAGARFVTDKQPQNFLSVGLIRHLFPEARIIYIRRNPLETGFSIFRRNFTRQWSFSTALEDIAHYYGEQARIADHWMRVLGDGMAVVQYETLVADFEEEIRRLVAFCGLEWNDACLSYFDQDRPVLTFSAAQVREAPSVSYVSSTGPYLDFLTPLEQGLAAAGVDLTSGALVNK